MALRTSEKLLNGLNGRAPRARLLSLVQASKLQAVHDCHGPTNGFENGYREPKAQDLGRE